MSLKNILKLYFIFILCVFVFGNTYFSSLNKNALNAQGDRLLRAGLPREGPLPLLAQPRDGQAVLLHLEHGPGSLRDVRDETIVFLKKSKFSGKQCRLAQDASKQAELGGVAPNPKVHLVGNECRARRITTSREEGW